MSRIPANAERVFDWVRFSVWQWQQEMFDGSFHTFEIAKRFDGVQGVWIQDDRIILPREIQPWWDTERVGLFGGVMEEWEDPLEAMQREFLEETGMEWELQEWMKITMWGAFYFDEYFYLIRNTKKIQEVERDAGEKITLHSYTFEEFLDLILQPFFRNEKFAYHIVKEYILPGKQEELHELFFGK